MKYVLVVLYLLLVTFMVSCINALIQMIKAEQYPLMSDAFSRHTKTGCLYSIKLMFTLLNELHASEFIDSEDFLELSEGLEMSSDCPEVYRLTYNVLYELHKDYRKRCRPNVTKDENNDTYSQHVNTSGLYRPEQLERMLFEIYKENSISHLQYTLLLEQVPTDINEANRDKYNMICGIYRSFHREREKHPKPSIEIDRIVPARSTSLSPLGRRRSCSSHKLHKRLSMHLSESCKVLNLEFK